MTTPDRNLAIMKHAERIDRIIRLVLASGSLKGERPLSLFILAKPGAGKTELLSSYAQHPGVIFSTYTSFSQLVRGYLVDLKSGTRHHIIVPDIAVLIGKPREVVVGELAIYGCLIEEGILQYSTMQTQFRASLPRTVGMLIAGTEESMLKMAELAPPGFLSRFLYTSYKYSELAKQDIYQDILSQQYRNNSDSKPMTYPMTAVTGNQAIFERLAVSPAMSKAVLEEKGDTYGFRTLKQMQTLLMANALIAGRDEVIWEDLLAVMQLFPYMNQSYNEL